MSPYPYAWPEGIPWDEDTEERELDLDKVREAIAIDGPPTRREVEANLGRECTDEEWRTVRDLCPAPVACIDCGCRLLAATGDWLDANGWDVWRGGCRCPACSVRRSG